MRYARGFVIVFFRGKVSIKCVVVRSSSVIEKLTAKMNSIASVLGALALAICVSKVSRKKRSKKLESYY